LNSWPALKLKKCPPFSKSSTTHHPYLPVSHVIEIYVSFLQARCGPETFPGLTLFPYLSIGPTESAGPQLILDVIASFILLIALHLKKEADLTSEIRHVSYPAKEMSKAKQ